MLVSVRVRLTCLFFGVVFGVVFELSLEWRCIKGKRGDRQVALTQRLELYVTSKEKKKSYRLLVNVGLYTGVADQQTLPENQATAETTSWNIVISAAKRACESSLVHTLCAKRITASVVQHCGASDTVS